MHTRWNRPVPSRGTPNLACVAVTFDDEEIVDPQLAPAHLGIGYAELLYDREIETPPMDVRNTEIGHLPRPSRPCSRNLKSALHIGETPKELPLAAPVVARDT